MSIFSRISRSRQQAKEHNAKVADQQKKEDETKVPYKHTPTHAAADAFSSAPPSWRESDRLRIREEHRRRMNMLASQRAGIPGMPRIGSSLSHVSYPTDVNASPMIRTPRAHSYTGVSYPRPPNVPENGAPETRPPSSSSSPKGKEVSRQGSRGHLHQRAYHKATAGESGSSDHSSSSQDDLEMGQYSYHQGSYSSRIGQPSKQPPRYPAGYARQPGRPPNPASGAAEATVHRLTPSRRISDTSIDSIAMANVGRAYDSRPPSAMKAYVSSSSRATSPESYDTPRSFAGSSSRRDSGSQRVAWAPPSPSGLAKYSSSVSDDQRPGSASHPRSGHGPEEEEEEEEEEGGEEEEYESGRGSPSSKTSRPYLRHDGVHASPGGGGPGPMPHHPHHASPALAPRFARSSPTPPAAAVEGPGRGTDRQELVSHHRRAETALEPATARPHEEHADDEADSDSDDSFKSAQLAPLSVTEQQAPRAAIPVPVRAPTAVAFPAPPTAPPPAPPSATTRVPTAAPTAAARATAATSTAAPTTAAAATIHAVVNYLPEAEFEPHMGDGKSKRLSKGGKSGKKGRWPFHKPSAVAVV